MRSARLPFWSPTVAMVVTVGLALSGCGTFLGSGSGGSAAQLPSAQKCKELLTDPEAQPTGHRGATEFLADGSASTVSTGSAGSGRQGQDWAAMLMRYVPKNGGTLVSAGVFGGDVDWRIRKVTPGDSSDNNRNAYAARDVPICLKRDLARAFQAAPGKAGTDILRALSQAGEELQDVDGPKQIVIATDGLSNTGCADVRAAPIGDHSAIPGIVKSCRPEIPKLDKDIHVRMIGLGNPADGWPDVKTPHRVWLVDLWSQLCKATGATCFPASSKAPERTRVSGTAKRPADPEVKMPAIEVDPSVNPAVITVPDSVLFDFDSSRLAPRAQDAVEQIMRFLGQVKYTKIEVRGHTDAQGTPEHNQTLSTDRADAVRSALKTKGARKLTAEGFGERKPRCTPQYKNGVPDPVAMACNRRVEVVVYH